MGLGLGADIGLSRPAKKGGNVDEDKLDNLKKSSLVKITRGIHR